MRVCVIGTEYVGLVTGACLAHIGHHVICVENNEEKVKLLQAGQSPIFEPGLSKIMLAAIQAGRIEFTTNLGIGVTHGEIVFIAVGTPRLPTGETDTRYVEAVAESVGTYLDGDPKVIAIKSTVPIGFSDRLRTIVLDSVTERQQVLVGTSNIRSMTLHLEVVEATFNVVSNPGFLQEGSAVHDTFNPDRIVLGGSNPKALAMMRELYAPIIDRRYATDPTLPPVPVLVTDLISAETIKHTTNAFLATKIGFINEIANICDRVGADITQVAKGIGLDSRIGDKFLQAGIGWGGSCLPKDISALIYTAEDYGCEAELLKAVVSVNHRQRLVAIEKLQQVLTILQGKTIGLLGLSFKPNTDNMYDAPALHLIEQLNQLEAKVKAYDPIVSQSGICHGLSGVLVETNPEQLADGCDALILVTDWKQFQQLDYRKLAILMATPIMIDGRNFLSREELQRAGFYYLGIGC
ncbi:MAG: UDP-glucose 6-dehydrogenase TuaD [Chroococcidiopsis cubana SAG 39.79]|uniref:UDP-glucose 6-dehydrogenase n=1 Tax=Chroococcidiopsis cubana SAG 39.79 TaxID=388085 RepID=A0AB37UBE0_9CYAN|nr:UDP-glucose/GDP-mannose dehydrogenase family protein [Chroococcidiopsis cubana]MDZ4871530.1 UDP-glucose 6-dehydrogenase TuaD [Chroococcidiopsis cubana SAG 39.79]PSB64743.1 UDP-glucose 6-dehydrogenase [Chroococcidiopsis cubana CCALA 043]RUT04176.1 UDP-glucose 6-dehydrogenase [Chroococcidiopsis cubana SAG 39.79]